jgi:hypothetical protein
MDRQAQRQQTMADARLPTGGRHAQRGAVEKEARRNQIAAVAQAQHPGSGQHHDLGREPQHEKQPPWSRRCPQHIVPHAHHQRGQAAEAERQGKQPGKAGPGIDQPGAPGPGDEHGRQQVGQRRQGHGCGQPSKPPGRAHGMVAPQQAGDAGHQGATGHGKTLGDGDVFAHALPSVSWMPRYWRPEKRGAGSADILKARACPTLPGVCSASARRRSGP